MLVVAVTNREVAAASEDEAAKMPARRKSSSRDARLLSEDTMLRTLQQAVLNSGCCVLMQPTLFTRVLLLDFDIDVDLLNRDPIRNTSTT